MLLCCMLPALKNVDADGVCTTTLNHYISNDASAVHSSTAACMKFRLEYLLKQRYNCHMRQVKLNGLYYYGIVYHSHIMMEPNKMSN